MDPRAPTVASSPPPQTGRQVVRVIALALGLNLLLAGLKLLVGLISGNLTVFSDAMNSFLDAANNVLGIIAVTVSWRPPDANHPYGHRKFEALASLAIGALMTLTSWEILKTIVSRLFSRVPHAPPLDSYYFIGVIGLGLGINLFLTWFELRRGRALGSSFLIAAAADTRSDVLVTVSSLASLLTAPHVPFFDEAFAIVIVGFIMRTGWRVLRENVLLLTDAVQMDPEPIRRLVDSLAGVKDCHAIRTRGMPDAIHLDLHIVVPPDASAAQTHAIESRVREALLDAFPQIADVAIHHQTEPPITSRPFRR